MRTAIRNTIAGGAALGLVLTGAITAQADEVAPPAEETVSETVVEAPPAPEAETVVEVQEEAPVAQETTPEAPAAPEVVAETVVAPATTTLRWILPNGGTPENVTWDQPEATPENLALVPCGETVTIQVDTLKYSTPEEIAAVDALNDDGYLRWVNGGPEDSGLYISHVWDTYTAPACEEEPPAVINECTTGTGTHSTNLADLWGNVDTRSKGHVEYVEGGLHIWTEDNSSQSKVSEGIAVNIKGHDIGVLDIDATPQTGNNYPYGPGLNLFIDVTGDLVADGTLVYEEVYGQDLWVTNGSAQAIKDASDHTGGNGSENHGTINKFLETFPDFTVVGLAYALGSGVHGDWVINSITAGCATHTFDFEEVIVEEPPVEEPPVVVPPVVEPPVEVPEEVPAALVVTADDLAETGQDGINWAPLGVAGLALLAGIAALIVARRRQEA